MNVSLGGGSSVPGAPLFTSSDSLFTSRDSLFTSRDSPSLLLGNGLIGSVPKEWRICGKAKAGAAAGDIRHAGFEGAFTRTDAWIRHWTAHSATRRRYAQGGRGHAVSSSLSNRGTGLDKQRVGCFR